VTKNKAVLCKRRGADGRPLSKKAISKLEAEATFLFYQTYLQSKGQETSQLIQGAKYGRDEH
jgi:hypothetical protein